MLVSHDHRFIYLKTFKTAGTSLEMGLEPLCAPPGHEASHHADELSTPHGIVAGRLKGAGAGGWGSAHVAAATVRERLGAETFDGYLKTCSIRNPFDKTVSAFFFVHGQRRRRAGKRPLEKVPPHRQVRQFRRYVAELHDKGRFGSPKDIDHRVTHVEGRPIIDRYIRMERMEEDVTALCEAIGAPREAVVIHSVKRHQRGGDSRPIGEWYDGTTARIVRDGLGWMFEAGGYPDDPAAAERASLREIA